MFNHSEDVQQAQSSTGAPVVNNSQSVSNVGLNDIPASQEPIVQAASASANDFFDPASSATTPQPSSPTAQNPFSSQSNDVTATSPVANSDVDLADIKQKALKELSPLVSHLEQDPLDKFKTTMMMIQASDNKNLIPEAYTAAQAITDEKAKAQALLDIVNEINYFTQQTSS